MKRAILLLLIFFPGVLFAQISVTGKMKFRYSGKPGAVIRDSIKVYNSGPKESEVNIYLSDYDGVKFYKKNTLPRSSAAWITIKDERVLLAPNSSLDIGFVVRVPKKLKSSGAFFCLLFVHEKEPMLERNDKPIGLKVRRRYGFPIVVNLPGGQYALEFKKIAYEDGKITIGVKNTGSLVMPAVCSVQVAGGLLESDMKKVYPGGSKTFVFERTIPDGEYKSRIFIDIEGGDIFAARHTFKIGKKEESHIKKNSTACQPLSLFE